MLWHTGPILICMLKVHLDCGIVGFEKKFITLLRHRFVCTCVCLHLYACIYKNKIEYMMGSSP